MKTEGDLQQRAVQRARRAMWPMAAALVAISAATPLVKVGVLAKWFGVPQVFALLPVPLVCALAFFGLAYSIFPDIVIGGMTVWEAAISTASLNVIFFGVAATLPVIIGYTVYMYRVFWGKATELRASPLNRRTFASHLGRLLRRSGTDKSKSATG